MMTTAGGQTGATNYSDCLRRLRQVADRFGLSAMDGNLPVSARKVWLEAETSLTRALGELDNLVNKGRKGGEYDAI